MDAHNRSLGDSPFILIFRGGQIVALREFKSRLTIGRASTADICIDADDLAALHGQIVMDGSRILYRHLQSNECIVFPELILTSIASLSVVVGPLSDLLSHCRGQFLESFQKILRQERDISRALEKVKSLWMAFAEIPDPVGDMLRKSIAEVQCMSPVEELLRDSEITDILISDFDLIFIEKNGRLHRSDLQFVSPDSYRVYLENLLSQVGRFVGDDYPYCDFVLADGSRAHFIGEQVTGGPRCLSIRKIRRDQWTLQELHRVGMISTNLFEILIRAVHEKKSIIIAGATGSGKTSLMRALLAEVPENQRLIILEDTPEILLERKNKVSLYTRHSQGTTLRAITLRDLVRQSLRMRPDRLIVGEVRGEEALDLLHALNTGHSGSLCTLHANSSRDALYRLEGLVRMAEASLREDLIRDWISRSLDLILFCSRDSGGRRVVSSGAWVRGQANQQILLEELLP